MPSIADSKKLVRDAVNAGPNHDAILASLQHEIDKHNRIRSDTEEHIRRRREREKPTPLKYKNGERVSKRRRHRRRHDHTPEPALDDDDDTAHPFPREPQSTSIAASPPPDDAFMSSLLDALADDEAAAYWESVYSQPIHAFARPSVQTEKGELEQMSDEHYAAWVKQKMWDKQHPKAVAERDRMARKRKEEEMLKRRRREEFVKRREKEEWHDASRYRQKDDDYVFDLDSANTTAPIVKSTEWQDAWTVYLQQWEKLKKTAVVDEPSKVLPWPTLPSKPPTRPHIEDFMRNMPLQDGKTRQHVLKAERVRWHPDKIQQRFQGKVDEGTMKVVTGIFQIVDSIWNDEVAAQR